MPNFLEKKARGADVVVLQLDSDKEGENICFEVIDCIQPSLNPNVKRRISSTLQRFFSFSRKFFGQNSVRSPTKTFAKPSTISAIRTKINRCRSTLDKNSTCESVVPSPVFKRVISRASTAIWTAAAFPTGRVKRRRSASALIVTTKSNRFSRNRTGCWSLKYVLSSRLEIDWRCSEVDQTQQRPDTPLALGSRTNVRQRDRLFLSQHDQIDQQDSVKFRGWTKTKRRVRRVFFFSVVSTKSEKKHKARPNALNTVELLKVASAGLGMSPHHAMQIAERLYTSGYISYPRTETTQYADNADLK